MHLKLSEFLIYLITKKHFYGRLVSSLQRVIKPGLGTLAVGVRDGRAVIFFDPAFLEGLSLSAGLFAVEHEMLHLALDHIPRYLELLAVQPTDEARVKAASVYNIAMDCAINTMLRNHEGFAEAEAYLVSKARETYDAQAAAIAAAKAEGKDVPELPPFDPAKAGMCLPEKWDLPLEGSFESYQYLLMQKVKLQKISTEFGGNTHGFWTEGQGDGDGKGKEGTGANGLKPSQGEGKGNPTKDLIFPSTGGMTPEEMLSEAHRIREQTRETLRSVVRQCGGVGRGTLPGNVEEWLEEYLAPPIVPWWEVFSTYARMSRASKQKRTPQTPNRALLALSEEDDQIIPFPGRTRDQSWSIFVMVDTSGSMSTESLEILQSELFYMLAVDEGMKIRYMQGDSEVHFDEELVHGDAVPKQMVGRGGTDFDAYFEYMKKYVDDSSKAPDLVVVYTDGYAPPVSVDNRLPLDIPIVWLVTPQHSEKFAEGYGTLIVCDPGHNERRKKA